MAGGVKRARIDPVRGEVEAAVEDDVRLQRGGFPGQEWPEDPPLDAERGEISGVVPGLEDGEVGGVDGDRRAGSRAQFGGAAEVIDMAVGK